MIDRAAIRSVVEDWQQAKVIGGKAAYEKLIREDVPKLLDELEAVETAALMYGSSLPQGFVRELDAILEGGER